MHDPLARPGRRSRSSRYPPGLGACGGCHLTPGATFLAAPVDFLAAPDVLLAAPDVLLAAPLVAFLVVFLAAEDAFLPVSAGAGGNHTTLVAFALATNEAPLAAHLPRSVRPFNPPVMSIICCSL